MPDNARAIEPALRKREWKECIRDAAEMGWPLWEEMYAESARIEKIILDDAGNYVANPDCSFAVMALANAALPDDDPRKITREDVAWLNDAAQHLDRLRLVDDDAADAQRLAAKLAALLPPE